MQRVESTGLRWPMFPEKTNLVSTCIILRNSFIQRIVSKDGDALGSGTVNYVL